MAELLAAVMHGISQRAAETDFPVLDSSLNTDLPVGVAGRPAPYLTIASAPAPPARQFSSPGRWMWSGIAIVTLAAPLGRPLVWHIQNASLIAALFPADGLMRTGGFCIRFTQPGYPLSPQQDGAFMRTPVRVHWQCAKR